MDQAAMEQSRSSPVPNASNPSTPMTSSLPADDGMQQLREKIHEIKNLAASTEEMAKRIHSLMTRDYLARRNEAVMQDNVRRDAGYRTDLPKAATTYDLSPEDLVPSYNLEDLQEDETLGDDEQVPSLGCVHYKRNVKVQCFDCRQWFPCRHCHDASPNLPFAHALNRRKTQNMLCMLCSTPQPASGVCNNCGQDSAWYYCSICKLWDNDSTKRIYHCDDCGICRRGEGLGKDYVHCKRCNVCISISTSSTHPCVERATDCDCPLCLDYLFSSSTPVVSLLCGHYMHGNCYKDLMNVTYRCPVCNKSAVNMELQWRKLDDEIQRQPMPEEEFMESTDESMTSSATNADTGLAASIGELQVSERPAPQRRRVPRRVWVGCNDCGGHGWTNFHWLGLKCSVCDGYNTNQTAPVNGSTVHTAPIPGVQRQRQHDFTGVEVLRAFGGGVEELESGNSGPDFAHGSPSSPSQQVDLRAHLTEHLQPRRSYFLRAEQEERQRSSSAPDHEGEGGRFLPYSYDFLQRFGRNLSPMRYYLDGLDDGEVEQDSSNSKDASTYPAHLAKNPIIRRASDLLLPGERSKALWDRANRFIASINSQEGEGRVRDDKSDEDSEGEDDNSSSDGDSIDADADAKGDGEGETGDEDEMELFGHR